MKKIIFPFSLLVVAWAFVGCLYTPEKTYVYWKLSTETQMYSEFKAEAPLSPDEMKELRLVDKLPENAKVMD